MKKNKYKIILVGLLSIPIVTSAQWSTIGTSGRTLNSTITKIGVGFFPSTPSILSKLNVNSYLLATDAPTNGLMFRTDGDQTVENRCQLYTGTSSTLQAERFRLYTQTGTSPFVGFRNYSNGLLFETAGALERMRINGSSTGNTWNGFIGLDFTGNVGITPTANSWAFGGPKTALHIYDDSNGQQALGYRPWMRTGVMYSTSKDWMFTGMRIIQQDITEAVLAFGEDGDFNSLGPDQMVVRFLNGTGSALSGANSMEGLELMRFSGIGNGRVGVGDEFSHTSNDLQPQRRMHIHDPGIDSIANAQLRISNFLSASSPIATDFRVTPLGNLYINMYGSQQRVGIEEASPKEKLDVKGNARFQDIPNTAANCVIFGQTVTTGFPQDNRLKRLDFNNDPDTYLAGNGTWQPTSPGICDWNLTGINDLATGYTGACRTGNTGIGISAPIAKLDVVRLQTTPAIADPTALRVTATDNPGIIGQTIFGLNSAPTAFGTYSTATNNTNATTNAIGGYFRGGGANSNNVGVYGTYCQPNQTNLLSYAIYGYQPVPVNSACAIGPGFAGFFNGDVRVINGDLTLAAAPIISSDESIKTNVAAMEGATEKLLMLNPVTYYLTNTICPKIIFPTDMQCGLIAQEVAEVFPELVEDVIFPDAVEGNDEPMTLKGVQYTELIPVLIKGFQEQTKRIQNLEEQLAVCCSAGMQMQGGNEGEGMQKSTNITLGNKNTLVLNQNVPNPFAEKTTISYNLPETVAKAQILFYDQKGALINSQELNTRGAGQLVVFADDLSSGTYSYALVVDGKIMDTKTMVKSK